MILRHPDPPAGGGGDPPADPPAPVTIPWEATMADEGLPDVFKPFKGKSLNDVASAHHELRTELNTRATKISGLEGDLKKANETAAKLKESAGPSAAEAKRMTDTRALWQSSLNKYYEDEQGDEQILNQLQEKTSLTRRELLDVHENMLGKRRAFLGKAEIDHPSINIPDLETWVRSGESPFDEGQLRAFYMLADEGYTGWLPLVQAQYDKHIEQGGRPVAGQAAPDPLLRGRPGTTAPDGYATRAAFQADYAAAERELDPAKKEVMKGELARKLEASDKAKW